MEIARPLGLARRARGGLGQGATARDLVPVQGGPLRQKGANLHVAQEILVTSERLVTCA